jgi:GT2 family glycosyltransferase
VTGRPELSVVVVSYRCGALLRDCLTSLDRNRDDLSMQVIVVDNASGDDTVHVARECGCDEMIALDRNVGFARANNIGIARATGEAVLVLNPDTVVPPGALRTCLDVLARDPGIGVLTPRLVDGVGRMDRRCRRGFPTLWGLLCYFTGLDRLLPGRRSRGYTMGHVPDDIPADVDAVSGAFMLMPAEALHRVGTFDEQFFMYAEDIDLCMRFKEVGYRVHYWPGVDVVHIGGGSSAGGRRSARANVAYFRTLTPLIRKHRRSRASAAAAWLAGEAGLAASRIVRTSRRPG